MHVKVHLRQNNDSSETLTPQLSEFTGKYVSEELVGATYTLGIKDGKLSLEIRNGITVFSDRGLVLAFGQTSGGEARKYILLTPALGDVFLTYLEVLQFTRNLAFASQV